MLIHADQNSVDEIFGGIKHWDGLFANCVAPDADLACNPDRFIYLLKRITNVFDQGIATQRGVITLFDRNQAGCFDALLTTLEKDTTINSSIVAAAKRQAFVVASAPEKSRAPFAMSLYADPAIDAETYARGMNGSLADWGLERGIFYWLLDNASRVDLEEFVSLCTLRI